MIVNAEKKCKTVNEGGVEFEICWEEEEPVVEEPVVEEPVEEPVVDEEPDEEQDKPEDKPKDDGEKINKVSIKKSHHAPEDKKQEVVFNVETNNEENAEFKLQVIEEQVSATESVSKPKLDINLDAKTVTKIPIKVDVKVIPYSLYSMFTLCGAAFLVVLLIVKDFVF